VQWHRADIHFGLTKHRADFSFNGFNEDGALKVLLYQLEEEEKRNWKGK
jgi:hypothetical protein